MWAWSMVAVMPPGADLPGGARPLARAELLRREL